VPDAAAIEVACNVCHVVGTVEIEPHRAQPMQDAWESLPCFFTPRCIGHVWPDLAN
jgi:hypothetical protein